MNWRKNSGFDTFNKPIFWKIVWIKTVLKIVVLLFFGSVFSQEQSEKKLLIVEKPKAPLVIGISDAAKNPNYFSIKKPESTQSTPSFSMTDQEKFLNPGASYQRDINKSYRDEEGNSKTYFGDSYLGDFKTASPSVLILCRDFGDVDGDRISVLVNDEVLIADIWLTSEFFKINLPLKKGFNKIDFTALNQGRLGPNTAEMKVYDSEGLLIHSNKWNLSSGSSATIILVKEE